MAMARKRRTSRGMRRNAAEVTLSVLDLWRAAQQYMGLAHKAIEASRETVAPDDHSFRLSAPILLLEASRRIGGAREYARLLEGHVPRRQILALLKDIEAIDARIHGALLGTL